MSVRRSHDRRNATPRRFSPDQLRAQVGGGGPAHECSSFVLPHKGLCMPCPSPCAECDARRAYVEERRPAWEAYRREHPVYDPTRTVDKAPDPFDAPAPAEPPLADLVKQATTDVTSARARRVLAAVQEALAAGTIGNPTTVERLRRLVREEA